MSESEEEDNFELYGTPLEPLDEDTIPKKKPFSIEDQVATDEQGRRRFHGAFTGGFSAGFFNTVGSLEGWKPSEFKSSRSEKAGKKQQKPEDFMDDEDTGAYGIAPKKLKATSDYSQVNKRKRIKNIDGPIPGDPVLFSLLEVAKETVGVRLLKKMGWKPGQGVGPRVSKTEKTKINRERKKNTGRIYGCEVPDQFKRQIGSDSDSSDSDFDINFAPDDYDAFVYKPKDNCFGMGYSGLNKTSVLGHVNLFAETEFRMQDRNNKKVSITGQAFGVGAFENEDEDIYHRDDMTKYDFTLDTPGKKNKKPQPQHVYSGILDGFIPAQSKPNPKKIYTPPELPKGFIAKHGARISRFDPLPETHKFFKFDRSKNTGRHDLTPSDRSKIINTENITITDNLKKQKDKILSGTIINKTKDIDKEERRILMEKAKKITEGLTRTPCGNFKPFSTDEDKQNRYEIYLTLSKNNLKDKLTEIQPPSMSDWEKNREKSEFEQAARLFKPTTGLIFDKFVSSSNPNDSDPLKPADSSIFEHGTQEMRDAAKKKMFGPLTRVVLPWTPHKLLCRRFNVPEPKINEDIHISAKRKNKFNVFDYYEAYQQNKTQEGSESSKEQNSNSSLQENIITIEEPTKIEEISDNIKDKNLTPDHILPSTSADKGVLHFKNIESVINHPETIEEVVKSNKTKEVHLPSTSTNKQVTDIKHNELAINEGDPIEKVVKNDKTKEPEVSIPTDPQAKKDLFKSIFLSSSESEDESEHEEEQNKFKEMKKVVEESIKKPEVEKPSRFTNKGFFADLDLSKLNKSSEKDLNLTKAPKTDDPKKDKINDPKEDYYGPKLPNLPPKNTEWKPTFQKPNKPKISDQVVIPTDNDEWIEVDKNKTKEKHHKKHKKHKEKHKKHKSKHKKRKKSESN